MTDRLTILQLQKSIENANFIIKRQNAEIERLKEECDSLRCTIDDKNYAMARLEYRVNKLQKYDEQRDIALHSRLISTARTEAVKEFAEAYKNQIENCTGMFTAEGFYIPRDAVLNSIDFIYERLVGEG